MLPLRRHRARRVAGDATAKASAAAPVGEEKADDSRLKRVTAAAEATTAVAKALLFLGAIVLVGAVVATTLWRDRHARHVEVSIDAEAERTLRAMGSQIDLRQTFVDVLNARIRGVEQIFTLNFAQIDTRDAPDVTFKPFGLDASTGQIAQLLRALTGSDPPTTVRVELSCPKAKCDDAGAPGSTLLITVVDRAGSARLAVPIGGVADGLPRRLRDAMRRGADLLLERAEPLIAAVYFFNIGQQRPFLGRHVARHAAVDDLGAQAPRRPGAGELHRQSRHRGDAFQTMELGGRARDRAARGTRRRRRLQGSRRDQHRHLPQPVRLRRGPGDPGVRLEDRGGSARRHRAARPWTNVRRRRGPDSLRATTARGDALRHEPRRGAGTSRDLPQREGRFREPDGHADAGDRVARSPVADASAPGEPACRPVPAGGRGGIRTTDHSRKRDRRPLRDEPFRHARDRTLSSRRPDAPTAVRPARRGRDRDGRDGEGRARSRRRRSSGHPSRLRDRRVGVRLRHDPAVQGCPAGPVARSTRRLPERAGRLGQPGHRRVRKGSGPRDAPRRRLAAAERPAGRPGRLHPCAGSVPHRGVAGGSAGATRGRHRTTRDSLDRLTALCRGDARTTAVAHATIARLGIPIADWCSLGDAATQAKPGLVGVVAALVKPSMDACRKWLAPSDEMVPTFHWVRCLRERGPSSYRVFHDVMDARTGTDLRSAIDNALEGPASGGT